MIFFIISTFVFALLYFSKLFMISSFNEDLSKVFFQYLLVSPLLGSFLLGYAKKVNISKDNKIVLDALGISIYFLSLVYISTILYENFSFLLLLNISILYAAIELNSQHKLITGDWVKYLISEINLLLVLLFIYLFIYTNQYLLIILLITYTVYHLVIIKNNFKLNIYFYSKEDMKLRFLYMSSVAFVPLSGLVGELLCDDSNNFIKLFILISGPAALATMFINKIAYSKGGLSLIYGILISVLIFIFSYFSINLSKELFFKDFINIDEYPLILSFYIFSRSMYTFSFITHRFKSRSRDGYKVIIIGELLRMILLGVLFIMPELNIYWIFFWFSVANIIAVIAIWIFIIQLTRIKSTIFT